ncbi:unnamed protein product [Orchesella dallaii]|uniref:EF-hand domain-containing protein n=1 Tax=Orchesella dallaii TaxID=48710 RepID=A0ABP1PUA2_9HEXA
MSYAQPQSRNGHPEELDRQLSFSQVDKDASGTVELEEVQSALPQIPPDQVAQMFADADQNKDGYLDRQEYSGFLASLRYRTENFAEVVVLPRRERTASRRIRQISEVGVDAPPVKIEKKFPFFIVSISLLEWVIFKYCMVYEVVWLFIYHPLRRYEIWRYGTVMLLHGSSLHLWGNVIMQLILGCLLEVIHHWKRVGVVYICGVVFGTLAGSVVQPWNFLIGASGGVYALLVAHLATIILNWNEMGCAFLRCILLLAYIGFDIWLVISQEIIAGKKSDTSHAGHFGGALAGLLIGINVLKNFEQRPWEIKLQKVCWILAIAFVILCAIANLGFQIYYWTHDPELFDQLHFYVNETETGSGDTSSE